MCGIVGIYLRDSSRVADAGALRAMCDAIRHRGPDSHGVHIDGPLGMGMRRLSVIDIEGGRQPLFNEDRSVAVMFNGEIYNHGELRRDLEARGHRFRTRCDTEVLAHGYEEWGDDLPRRLNGMFAFSVWDARRRRLLLARDHVGIKPLFIYRDRARIAWASELKALLALDGVEPQLEPAALVQFLKLGYVPAPLTMFSGIEKVAPASIVLLEDGRDTEASYWCPRFEPEERSMDAWTEELRALVDDAVRRQLMSDVPLGAFLSGGVDSSAIVSTMRRVGANRISTYSIGFGAEDAFHSELDRAREIASGFETDHHEIVVAPDVSELLGPLIAYLDEPFTDTSFIVTYLVSRLARESVTVILSGIGGDEVFAGYRRYLWPTMQRLYGRLPGVVRSGLVEPVVRRARVGRGTPLQAYMRYMSGFLEHSGKPDALRYQGYVGVFDQPDLLAMLRPGLRAALPSLDRDAVAASYEAAPARDPLGRMLFADLKTALPDSLLAFTDRMSMAVSLEARVPLLDHRIVELAARIPSGLKLRGLRGLKHLFRQAMADRLPRSVLNGPKKGFGTPMSRWLRTSLRPLARELLSPERLCRRGYFEPAAVEALLQQHLTLQADRSEHLLALMTLELWHERYLDRGAA